MSKRVQDAGRRSHLSLSATNGGAQRAELDPRPGLYAAIFKRRDIRHFRPDPVPDVTLSRILLAAHHAPSVGFTQPWSFIIVRDLGRRREVKRVFEQERMKNAALFSGSRRKQFLSFKLEGILEAPLNLIVTCQIGRFGPAVLGKPGTEQVELYSTCLAVQNLWLAARAEGLGVGWVSIVSNHALRSIFSLPPEVTPVAYLCVGYAERFSSRPTLEEAGWAPRLPLEQLLHFDSWDNTADERAQALARSASSGDTWRGIFPANEMPEF
jgi:5,6-dimethylbenzimidazole synthase